MPKGYVPSDIVEAKWRMAHSAQITFMRHGEARPRRKTETMDEFVRDELIRELTEKGRKEVPYLGEFDLVISSPAWRAIETATIAAGRKPDHIIIPLSTHLWPSANDNNDWELVDKVFVNGGDKRSLTEAYASANNEEKRACKRITKQAVKEIKVFLRHNAKVLVTGHALHLQALGYELSLKYDNVILKTAEFFNTSVWPNLYSEEF